MPLYALSISASAFLLFLLQLITAKQILPWFGGAAAVWITCLVFFQAVLLLGYAYADWSSRRLTPKQQAVLHGLLLALSLALLPITPDASWQPQAAADPVWRILALLAATIGLPYFLLSTTTPLLQSWFVRTYAAANPYRLFALSNLASMLALLGYPSAIEPWFSTSAQAQAWSLAYAAFVALCAAAAWHSLRSIPPGGIPSADAPRHEAVAPGMQLRWAALAATGAFLLLAVTNHLTQNIAAAPLLWVLPLSIYLLTFILCFDRRPWYRRNLFLGLLAVALCALAWRPADGALISKALFQIGLFSAGLFIACMFCHGELYRLRPAPRHLTRFYLMIALGGALGALLVGLAAPLVFPGYCELDIGLAALAALGLYAVRERALAIRCIGAGVLLFTLGSALHRFSAFAEDTVLMTRNFYGVLRVREQRDPANPERDRRLLLHGTVTHGDQLPHPRYRRALGTYYQTTSGIGRTLIALRRPGARVGVIGLGVGTLAAYGRPGDLYRFYEIDPAVVQIARREFSYLEDSFAHVETVLGDARLQLEREPGQQFDVLAVDAFAGDAVPMHLITREALAVYLRHIRPGGVIAFHVSNDFLDLPAVVLQLAEARGLKAAHVFDDAESRGGFSSDWVLLTTDPAFIDLPEIRAATVPTRPRPDRRVWTDDFNNLLQVLK
ncbi:MAG: fused MFS/spermidine synthase [Betaproteobacteria bacterium]|nr:fused MFS/spermidine synthase [Betaproteobacteria bacterium]